MIRAAVGDGVDHVTVRIDNRAGLAVQVDALDASGDRVGLGEAEAEMVTTFHEIPDIGARWTLVATYGGREVHRETLAEPPWPPATGRSRSPTARPTRSSEPVSSEPAMSASTGPCPEHHGGRRPPDLPLTFIRPLGATSRGTAMAVHDNLRDQRRRDQLRASDAGQRPLGGPQRPPCHPHRGRFLGVRVAVHRPAHPPAPSPAALVRGQAGCPDAELRGPPTLQDVQPSAGGRPWPSLCTAPSAPTTCGGAGHAQQAATSPIRCLEARRSPHRGRRHCRRGGRTCRCRRQLRLSLGGHDAVIPGARP